MKTLTTFKPLPTGARTLAKSESNEVSGGAFWLPFIGATMAGIAIYEYTRFRGGKACIP